MLDAWATPVAPTAGVRAVMVTAAVVKVQVTGAITLPAMSFAPLIATVWTMPPARLTVGSKVPVRVASL
jgi:hypothetical protein